MNCKEFEVRRDGSHYDVYVDGRFYCSADTLAEAARECKEYADKEDCV